jgi:hypothetical protein
VQLCASTVTIASVVKHSPGSVGARHRLVADPLVGLLAPWVAKKAIAVVEVDDEVWTVPPSATFISVPSALVWSASALTCAGLCAATTSSGCRSRVPARCSLRCRDRISERFHRIGAAAMRP